MSGGLISVTGVGEPAASRPAGPNHDMAHAEAGRDAGMLGSSLSTPLRFVRTARYLRPQQVVGRLWFWLHRPSVDQSPPPPLRRQAGRWRQAVERPVSMTAPNAFQFLNCSGQLRSAADWNAAERDKLWIYNLHYFDDLNAADNCARAAWHRDLIARWIAENPPADGNGWEPYPLSLRIVNWIKWSLAGNPLDQACLHSLAMQTRFLRRRIEWHLLGNHILANAKALVFSGLFFEGKEADEWRRMGLQILAAEIPEQILADGGHFELSPMYHAIIQEDLLDLVNLAASYPGALPQRAVADWVEVLSRMRTWLEAMVHPDGEIAFFNDAAIGIAAAPDALEAYADRLALPKCQKPGVPVHQLTDSGYVRIVLGDFVAILDVGRIGPDYQPGHAHADSLSFEVSIKGRRAIVNSGTSIYGSGPERQRQRSTSAHNTVEVDGENSSEVWGSFRVARRARPLGFSIAQSAGEVRVVCAHDGYRRLPGRVTHWREWRFAADGFEISDRLEGRVRRAVAHLHLSPAIKLDATSHTIDCGDGTRLALNVSGGAPRAIPSSFHPRFGVSLPAEAVAIEFVKNRCDVSFSYI